MLSGGGGACGARVVVHASRRAPFKRQLARDGVLLGRVEVLAREHVVVAQRVCAHALGVLRVWTGPFEQLGAALVEAHLLEHVASAEREEARIPANDDAKGRVAPVEPPAIALRVCEPEELRRRVVRPARRVEQAEHAANLEWERGRAGEADRREQLRRALRARRAADVRARVLRLRLAQRAPRALDRRVGRLLVVLLRLLLLDVHGLGRLRALVLERDRAVVARVRVDEARHVCRDGAAAECVLADRRFVRLQAEAVVQRQAVVEAAQREIGKVARGDGRRIPVEDHVHAYRLRVVVRLREAANSSEDERRVSSAEEPGQGLKPTSARDRVGEAADSEARERLEGKRKCQDLLLHARRVPRGDRAVQLVERAAHRCDGPVGRPREVVRHKQPEERRARGEGLAHAGDGALNARPKTWARRERLDRLGRQLPDDVEPEYVLRERVDRRARRRHAAQRKHLGRQRWLGREHAKIFGHIGDERR
mmetsp:Transcript_7648/g.24199  ORF Transcript_7648/g.24199 Transcript_7648/m.24199 type:complete len:482 (-) Transcript_7648:264-1709(-)